MPYSMSIPCPAVDISGSEDPSDYEVEEEDIDEDDDKCNSAGEEIEDEFDESQNEGFHPSARRVRFPVEPNISDERGEIGMLMV